MAYDVILADEAERDRDLIVGYLLYQLKSPQAAGNFLDSLEKVTEQLEHNPLLYAVSGEPRLASLGYRIYPFMRYVALYRIKDEGEVWIGRIFHASQDYARLA